MFLCVCIWCLCRQAVILVSWECMRILVWVCGSAFVYDFVHFHACMWEGGNIWHLSYSWRRQDGCEQRWEHDLHHTVCLLPSFTLSLPFLLCLFFFHPYLHLSNVLIAMLLQLFQPYLLWHLIRDSWTGQKHFLMCIFRRAWPILDFWG